MLKMCIVDLDGVVADSMERFKRAEEAKQRAYHLLSSDEATQGIASSKATDIYWRTAFTPELIALDTPIVGAIDALAALAFHGYYIMLLTSRPESLRKATRQWLYEQECPLDVPLVLKPPAFQYTKTPVWKSGMVQTLAALHGATIVKFVDDEEANWQEILKHTPYTDYSLQWLPSLRDMVRFLEEGEGRA